jgi:hypothetical protein
MTPSDQVEALRAEVAALRRQGRALLAVALLALAAAGWALWRGGPGRPGGAGAVQFEAQEYRLLDPDGALRGLWTCPPAGPSLIILDGEGRVAAQLSQAPGGGGAIRVADSNGGAVFQKP